MSIGRIYGIYKRALEKHAFKIQSLQTGFLLGLGDVISQVGIEADKPYDYRRTVRFTIIGIAIGPILFKWYKILDKLVGTEQNFQTVAKKVAADQLIMAPAMLATFLSTITLMEGGGYNELHRRLEHDYTDILLNNYKVWPAVQLVTFSMPLNYRVLFVQMVAIGWNTYLAWRINRCKPKKDKKQ